MFLGLTAFLVIRMWFGKAVEDFNKGIQEEGNDALHLIANTSNGFTSTYLSDPLKIYIDSFPVVWVAYAFHAVPLICALARLHVTTTASK